MGTSESGIAGWLARQSISGRLAIQATVAIILGILLVVTVGTGSYLKYKMTEKDDDFSQAALDSALLEKDFASLERDAFRHVLINDSESRENYVSNLADMRQSIADTRTSVQGDLHPQLDEVARLTQLHDEAVRGVAARGRANKADVAEIVATGNAVDGAIEVVRDAAIERSRAVTSEQQMLQKSVLIVTVLIVLLICAVSVVLAGMIKRLIGVEMQGIVRAIGQIEEGNLQIAVPHAGRSDDIGELARASERLRDARLSQVDREARTQEMVESFTDRLSRMSKGDLTVSLPDLGPEFEKLRGSFNETVVQLRNTMVSVAGSAGAVRHGSVEIRQASDDLAHRNETQASDLSTMTESVTSISQGMTQSATAADKAAREMEAAMEQARTGGEIVNRAIVAMDTIEASTTQIGNIITVIDGFSFQTSLLALNAGVEAARAGEVGRGFAVVANEVRNLAQRSSSAADEIRQLINASATEVATGAELVRETGQALDLIIQRVAEVAETAGQISDALSSHAANLNDARGALNDIDRSTQENAAMAEQSNAAARQLAGEADKLTQLVESFKLGSEQLQVVADKVAETGLTAGLSNRRVLGARRVPHVSTTQAYSRGNLAMKLDSENDDQDWSEF